MIKTVNQGAEPLDMKGFRKYGDYSMVCDPCELRSQYWKRFSRYQTTDKPWEIKVFSIAFKKYFITFSL